MGTSKFQKAKKTLPRPSQDVFCRRAIRNFNSVFNSWRAADLHWRRNLILHGPLSVTLRVTQELDMEAILSAYSRRDDTTLTLTTTGVEELFYKIGHVSGRFNQFMTAGDAPSTIASDDISRLQDFLCDNLPNPPTMQRP
jgi:hypothetical protein